MTPAPRDVPLDPSDPSVASGAQPAAQAHSQGTGPRETPQTTPGELSEREQAGLDRALLSWQRTLVDAGGPNTLLWFEDVPGGSLDLTTAHPGGVSMLMAGRATRLSDLVREPSAFAEARRRAEGIRHKTVELAQERGLTTGFMAIGMASWTVAGARRSPQAPVLLRGCSLHPTDPTHRDYDIDLSPAVELNPVLVHYLASEQGIDLDAEALAALAHSARRFDPLPVFRELTRLCRGVPNFRVADRKVVAPFSYAKLPLVADLVSHGSGYADQRLVRLLAAAQEGEAPEPASVTTASAAPEMLVLPADAQQRRVVAAVRAGQDVAVDAASGTGRTQTLTNVIAGLVADGKRVLVVSQNEAPLSALHLRLQEVGLGEAAAHVGEGGLDRGRLARAARDVFEAAAAPGREPDETEAQERLAARRVRLDAHRDAQHESREPWGVTVFEGLSALARLTRPRRPPTSRVRLTGDVLAQLDRRGATRAAELLTTAAAAGAWSEDRAKDPWAHARVSDEATAQRALAFCQELSGGRLETDGAALDAVLAASGLPAARVPADWTHELSLLEGVRATLQVFTPEIFGARIEDFLGATGDADYRREQGLRQAWWTRMSLRRQLKELVRPGVDVDLHAALAQARAQREEWARLSGRASTPRVPEGLDEARRLGAELDADLLWLTERLVTTAEGGDLVQTPISELRARLARLGGRADRIAVLPAVTPVLDELRAMGLGPLAEDLAARRVPTQSVAAELDFVWWRSILDEIAREDPRIGEHDAAALRQDAMEYAALDAAWMRTNVEIAAARHAQTARTVAGAHRDQVRLVQAEASGRPDHLSVDRLVAQAGDVVFAAVPCWLTSPLLVASILPPGEAFDVVVIEDAGRLEPAHAVAALSRARQVVLVGDTRSLPPTPFTTSVDRPVGLGERGGRGADGERRSILDVLGPHLTQLPLHGHYRSRDERVVAFANRHFYDGRLGTLPGASTAGGADPVRLVTVEEPPAPDVRASIADQVALLPDLVDGEVDAVVDLAVEHARRRPHESLAIGALTPAHAARIVERLRARLDQERDPAVVDVFDDDADEPCLVVPIERLHGQTRDALILTLGIEPGPAGAQRLGVLAHDIGERALAAALTMARRRVTLVTALTAADLDGRLRSRAATLLGELIAYCERGGKEPLPTPTAAPAQEAEGWGAAAKPGKGAKGAKRKGSSKAATGADSTVGTAGTVGSPAGPGALASLGAADEPSGATPFGSPVGSAASGPAASLAQDDPVLAEFAVRLRKEGLVVHERYGVGASPIDLVVEDPHMPGRAVVAVESDGSRDGRLTDTRERERLRPERLADLGWEYVRVYSGDIFADPARDVARVLDAVRAADARSSWSGRAVGGGRAALPRRPARSAAPRVGRRGSFGT